MIHYPISARDLMRWTMARVPAAGVVFIDAQVQRFYTDSQTGLCSFTIVTDPPVQETVEVMDLEGNIKLYEHTRQQHHLEIKYYNPEDEFEVRLSV